MLWVQRQFRALRTHPLPALFALIALVFVVCALVVEIGSLRAPLMAAHDWRQAHTYAPAYNFVHESANFFFPRINDREHHNGIIGMETPGFAYLISLAFRVFGDSVPVARWFAFLVTLAGLAWFGRTIAREESRLHAVAYAGWLALSPMVLCEARVVQPDAAAVSMMMISAAFFNAFARHERRRDFIGGLAFATAGVLMKTSILCLLPALWLFSIGRHRQLLSLRTIKLGVPVAIIPAAPGLAWHDWARYLTYRYADGLNKFLIEVKLGSILPNLRALNLRDNYFRFVVSHYATCWILLPTAFVGLMLAATPRHRALGLPMIAWVLGIGALDMVLADRLVSHWYYGAPLIAPLAYFACLGLGNAFAFAVQPRRCDLLQTWSALFVLGSFGVALANAFARPALARGDKALALVNHGVFAADEGPLRFLALFPLAVVLTVFVYSIRDSLPRAVTFAVTAFLVLRVFMLGQRDALAMFDYHAGLPEAWTAMEHEERATRASLDEWSTRKDIFVGLSGGNPILLHRMERIGFLPLSNQDAKTLGMGYFVKRGARFLFVNNRDEAVSLAPSAPMLAQGPTWQLYCLDPNGCPRRKP